MKKLILITTLVVSFMTFGQNSKLSIFDNLIGKTWRAEGNWGDGSKFKQEIKIEYVLGNKIILLNSYGFTDKEQTKLGLRNIGIRKYNEKTKSIKFWEFDVFGGLTEGTVYSNENKNIVYEYEYGGSNVTDMWEYVNDSIYNFKVGNYQNGIWKQIYLKTQFHSIKTNPKELLYDNLKNKLTGNWISKAWNGILKENWYIDKSGYLNQKAKYFENDKLLYEANNKIELIEGELILITVIKNASPKIFKATSFNKHEIVFENTEYKNPNKVIYKLISDKVFEREISGSENNKPSNYVFRFERNKLIK